MAKPAKLAETAERLHSVAVRLLRRARVADRSASVGPAQLSALSLLYFSGQVQLTALADAEQVAQPTMTRIVASLEKAGAARRLASPTDGREKLVEITDAGRQIFETARARRLEVIEALLAKLDAETVAALHPLILKLADVVNQRD
jgi:DNA-binding MarR family transcriptional regulator